MARPIWLPTVDSDGSDPTPTIDSLTVAGVVGGQRTISALSSGSMGLSSVSVATGQLTGTLSPNDGSTAPLVGLQYGGMGSFDITFAGAESRLAFRVSGTTNSVADIINVTFRVEDSGGDSDQVAVTIGSGATAYDELLEFPFSSIDPTVDLTSLDSLRLLFFNNNLSAGATIEIALLEATPVDLMLFEIE